MKYGYARVSTEDQNPALQLAALKKAGCRSVFQDEGISTATAQRPALVRCLKTLAGDTLIAWKLDRLGRSLRDLIHGLDDLKHRGVKFRSLTEAIDTATATPVPLSCKVSPQLKKLDRYETEKRNSRTPLLRSCIDPEARANSSRPRPQRSSGSSRRRAPQATRRLCGTAARASASAGRTRSMTDSAYALMRRRPVKSRLPIATPFQRRMSYVVVAWK